VAGFDDDTRRYETGNEKLIDIETILRLVFEVIPGTNAIRTSSTGIGSVQFLFLLKTARTGGMVA
jgi:hypothetical protein